MAKANTKASKQNALQIDESAACCKCGPCSDLVPKFTYAVVNDEDHTLTLTDTSTYPSGDGEDKQYFYLSQVGEDDITPIQDSPAVIDLSEGYNLNKDLKIKMKVVSDEGCIDFVEIVLSSATLQTDGASGTAQY